MKKKVIYLALWSFLIANLVYGATLYLNAAKASDESERNSAYQNTLLFTRVLEKVRSDYVDADKVTYEKLIQGALEGMLKSLDPHSEFMTTEKYQELKEDTAGAFGGVGIQVGIRDGNLIAITPIEDTPAYNAGVLAGDRIIKIDDTLTQKMELQDAVKLLRGEPGTDVTITISRPSNGLVKNITLTRAVIKVDTVKDIDGKRDFNVDTNGVGYVRLTSFGEQTATDLGAAVDKMKTQDLKGLIIDLRNNGGGLLDQAIRVCEMFLPAGQLVVSIEGRGDQKTAFNSTRRDKLSGTPIVILVNGGSASASEIVSGCLQDCKRAVILGSQTFGKGSVQSIIQLQDGTALRLTTAKYYTPSHKVIHEKGITPDILVPLTPDEEDALYLKKTPGGEEFIKNMDEKKRKFAEQVKDIQLERAKDLLKGIIICK